MAVQEAAEKPPSFSTSVGVKVELCFIEAKNSVWLRRSYSARILKFSIMREFSVH